MAQWDNFEITLVGSWIDWSLSCASTCLSLYKPSNIFFFFFRTTGPISTKFGTKYPWLKGFKFIQMKGHGTLSQEEIIGENEKQIDNF